METKFTIDCFKKAKATKEKITMLTAYDYTTARTLDDAGIDVLLIGDSLGMVILGYENTIQVTVEDIIHHSRAVKRGTTRAWTVADMPYLSYHISVEDTICNAGRIIKESNVHSVKLEGGQEVKEKIQALVKAQIPVMGHIGLTPQSVNLLGGFKAQGKNYTDGIKLLKDAVAVQEAGAFAVVLECVPAPLGKLISQILSIPTIGIGAGKDCDGQVLVVQDFLGENSGYLPRFVKAYGDMKSMVTRAVSQYREEINQGSFPAQEHNYAIDPDIMQQLEDYARGMH